MSHNSLHIITIQEDNITDFSAVRNRELAKIKDGWVLYLDSDETLSKELKTEIQKTINHESSAINAYSIPRLDTFLGKTLRHGETGRVSFVRLARWDWGQWERPVHEVWSGPGKVGQLHNPILHTPHPSISSFLAKINKYSEIEAKYRHGRRVKSSLLHTAFYPPAKFIKNYILKLGFLDGVPGAIHAIMMSFHSYLTWTKLYLLCKKH